MACKATVERLLNMLDCRGNRARRMMSGTAKRQSSRLLILHLRLKNSTTPDKQYRRWNPAEAKSSPTHTLPSLVQAYLAACAASTGNEDAAWPCWELSGQLRIGVIEMFLPSVNNLTCLSWFQPNGFLLRPLSRLCKLQDR